MTDQAHADLTPDDRTAIAPLHARGVAVEAAVWDDRRIDWNEYDAIVLRSCWDYDRSPDTFTSWLERVEHMGVRVWNPVSVVQRNIRKTYLGKLAEAGVPTIPTYYVDENSDFLDAAAWAHQFEVLIVKPQVGLDGRGITRVTPGADPMAWGRIRAAASEGGVMIQPFVSQIESGGEMSLVFFFDAFSHALVKRPAAGGDFRTQEIYGGRVEPVHPSALVRRAALAVLEHVPVSCLYARVDGIVVRGQFLLSELELTEPCLYLQTDPEAPARFAEAVLEALQR